MHANASHCPLCHQPNHCALAAQRESDTCWCHHQEFPSKAQLSKAQLPKAIAPDVCICQACAEALRLEVKLGVKRVD
ncbi:cysteine-rich CWC family protein [Shewanella aquimarina]|uniref:cysteine-rich CWC family protein n=1 Tax=Shewanella aquimarina TaxID=260365 RepID=UPI002014CCFF|nr:cysteine-rich CWC family protein [Shewanella aquimarina]MCL2908828.1 cysteine-rich CWC family protein [Shewanella aquimarina]